MPEALARTRHNSVLSAPARSAPPERRSGRVAATFRRLRALPARGYAGAALAAVLTGIAINALTLQHERHPAPFFAVRPPAAAAPAAAATPAAAPSPQAARPVDATSLVTLPPPRPADLGVGLTAGPRGVDAIGQMLREDSVKETQRSVLTAQNALIKLGYVLKADGVPNAATLSALRDFERAHSLPLSTDFTPRLLMHLTAAVAASER